MSKKIILFSITILFFIVYLSVFAQNNDLPSGGITPDSSFYFLDNLLEKINLYFSISPESKAEKTFQYSREKLAEARLMAFKNKTEEFKEAFQNYVDYLALGSKNIKKAKDQGKNIDGLVDMVTGIIFTDMQTLSDSLESMFLDERLTTEEGRTLTTKLSEALGLLEEDKEIEKKIGEKLNALEEKQKEENKGKLSKIEKSILLGTYNFMDYNLDVISAQGTWISDTDLAYPIQSSYIICMKDYMLCTEAIGQIWEDGFLSVSNELYDIDIWNNKEIVTKPNDFGCTKYIMRIDRTQKQVTATRTTTSKEGICEGMSDEPIHLYLGDGLKVTTGK